MFKDFVIKTFHVHCESGLYTLKSHLLENTMEDVNILGAWRFWTVLCLKGSLLISDCIKTKFMEIDYIFERGSGCFKRTNQAYKY